MERSALQLLILPLLLLAGSLYAAPEWQVTRSAQGVEVATRNVAGSQIAESRAVVHLQGVSVAAVAVLLRNMALQHEWVDSVDESRTLELLSASERIDYTLSKAPWPVADRDAVVRTRESVDAASGVVQIESHALPDYLPEQKGVVRVRKVDSVWTITPLADGGVEVVYQVHSEPGGNLPAWLINRVVYEQPFKTLLQLRDYLARSKQP